VFLFPPRHVVSHYENLTTFCFSGNFFQSPKKLLVEMDKCDDKPNTGEGDKGKRTRTTSDDVGGKSVSEKSKSGGGQCVGENSTGGKCCVDVVKDKTILYLICQVQELVLPTIKPC
jgi:hypothetical protein